MALITFITTCRGRLVHLRETLPLLVVQPDAAIVVVDYGCPDGSGHWVETHFPQVKVVRFPESVRFEVARARNLGAAVVRSPWICFIDADTGVAPDFCERVRPLLADDYFYQAEPRAMDAWGTTICATADFERVGGYDEVIQGWGKEDEDFYARLILARVRYAGFPGELVHVIKHADDRRVAHYDVKDRWLTESINHVYCRAKIDLMLLHHGQLRLEVRRQLYDRVHAAVMKARDSGKPTTIALPFITQETRVCGPVEGSLVYNLPRPRGDGHRKASIGTLIPRPFLRPRQDP